MRYKVKGYPQRSAKDEIERIEFSQNLFNLWGGKNLTVTKATKEQKAQFVQQTCPMCGKQFCPRPEWAYKIFKMTKCGKVYIKVCSYTCMRRWQRVKGVA